MNQANFKKALLAATIMAAAALACPKTHAGTPVTASCMAESPLDGSVWIGSNGQGLFRLGRNGRQVVYRAEEGKIPSNSIKTLFFDAENTLWILDAEGRFTLYSTIEGFQQAEGMPAAVDCALYDKKKDCIYLSSGNSLKSYKKVNTKTKELAALPSPAKSLKLAENEGDFLWVFCQEGVLKVGLDGSIQRWEDAPNVLNPLPLEFETNPAPGTVEEGNDRPLWLTVTGIILALLAGFAAGWLRKKKEPAAPAQPKENPQPKLQVQPAQQPLTTLTQVVETAQPAKQPLTTQTQVEVTAQPEEQKEDSSKPASAEAEQAPRQKEPVKAPKTPDKSTDVSFKGGDFTKKVYSLIKANLSDPDFDVENIAALTGISRIHVNRKLRTEGAPAPSAMIKEVRMKYAARLIRQGKLGISQISANCGFRTPSYFATAFKEFYGVSPSEFQEEK